MPTSFTLKSINAISKFEFFNLGLMLLLLHLALNQEPQDTYLVSALLLIHIGFFLLWQPALNAQKKIELRVFAPIFITNSILYALLGDWFLALWIILLIGLTSGSALVNGVQRSLYALATVILFLQLSLTITPRLFNLHVLDEQIQTIIYYTLFVACSFIIIWPIQKQRNIEIDYLHSIIISFGFFSFYITSILVSVTSNIYYLQALLITALSIGLFFILLSILWLPRHGVTGIGQIWEQHILNIGNPFETWVKQTSLLDQNKKITPELFLEKSTEKLLTLSWVCGIECHIREVTNLYGIKSKHQISFAEDDFNMTIYSHIPMGSALKIHAQLLMTLMSYFYTSKLREISLKNQTHLKAVYETGSKLTHDIKNILQSLQALTGVIHAADDPADSHALLSKQLPLLTQRLKNTLDKLQTKTDTGLSFKDINTWWTELQSRYHGRDIQFNGVINTNITIDTDVFDSVLENLLENARNKRRIDPKTTIITKISIYNDQPIIQVFDNGYAVPEYKVEQLFKQILPSTDGYGIGLYQAAQLASRNNFKLELINNEQGNVCFQISSSK